MPNLLLMTDSYKVSQAGQYPPNTQKIYTYLAARGYNSDWPYPNADMVFFGLQYQLIKYLEGQVITLPKIKEAKEFWDAHFGAPVFREDLWKALYIDHDGRLPIKIKALPEGSVVPIGTVLLTIENTDPKYFWLTNFLETLLVQLWYPCTVATRSREMKSIIQHGLKTSGTPESVDFKLQDFGYRGCTSEEQAAIGGAAHLVNFQGTDTAAGAFMLMKYYNSKMPGFSIPATEHSTITSWGKVDERKAIENHLDKYPTGIIACVMDSYDVYTSTRDILGKVLKDKILERDGVFVVRPDSGHPPDVIIDLLDILSDAFGFYENEKGFKVLNDKVRLIQGDGIDPAMLELILDVMIDDYWSADNIAFGSGGGLLQKDTNRDTLRFAAKCSAITFPHGTFEVFKDPVTDTGKTSLRGKQAVIRNANGRIINVRVDETPLEADLLQEVFVNGTIIRETNLEEVRELAKLVD